MNIYHFPPQASALTADRFRQLAIYAGMFWLLAYGVLTLHARLDITSSGRLFSEARMVATGAGGMLLFSILLLWDRIAGLRALLRLKMLALAIGGACAIMYAVRLIVAAQFGDFGATELADGGRWVIAWAGYFLASVSSFVTWQTARDAGQLRQTIAAAGGAAPDYECADALYASVSQPPV